MDLHSNREYKDDLNSERIFEDYYPLLLDEALRLEDKLSLEQAEDLVGEVYVVFSRSKPRPNTTDRYRLHKYLSRTLINLAHARRVRKGNGSMRRLLPIDFDTAEFALTNAESDMLQSLQNDLTKISEYVCLRRRSSLAASILILRYFFNYYPSEICKLLQLRPAEVFRCERIARQEVKTYLARPKSLAFLWHNASNIVVRTPKLPADPSRLLTALRRRILDDRHGACLTNRELEQRYTSGPLFQLWQTIPLSHLVGCAACLERASALVGIDSLSVKLPANFTVDRANGA